ncbi:MAG: TMEM175 family protein [Acidimicrobiales bacterium]
MSEGSARAIAGSGRVEAFSDGVLAIAITLLVLDLHSGTRPGAVGHDIVAQWPTYLAYAATFAYIGVVCVNHHSLFTRIARVDGGLLWCNLALLLPASVLPFPTAQLAFAMGHGTPADKLDSLALYAIVSSVMGMTWLIMFSYLVRHQYLVEGSVPDGFFRTERKRAVPGIIAPALPVLVGVWAPTFALCLMVVMPIFYLMTADGLRTRQRRGPPLTS